MSRDYMTLNQEAWEDDLEDEDLETWCRYCDDDTHSTEQCSEHYRCLYPAKCCMGSFHHSQEECYTAEQADAYAREMAWQVFWEKHPVLYRLIKAWAHPLWWLKIRFPYYGGVCGYCYDDKFWPGDDISCFRCAYRRAWEPTWWQMSDDDVPF